MRLFRRVAGEPIGFLPRGRGLLCSGAYRATSGLTLQADPSALAPERLLVFEVRGAIGNFANAIRRVPGLELIDEEELAADEKDKSPEAYLVVPDRAIISMT